ncbi:MAG: glycosyltransferase family 4 protein [Phycisphaerales bacterium]|jgi:colanic acid biosynthesis glycosyl transferase WcaI
MHVLIFNIYFHPEPTGTGLVIGQLAADLAALGHQVTVVTTVPHYGLDREGDHHRGRLIVEEQWEGVRVLRTGVPDWFRKGWLSRLSKYLGYTTLAVPAGLRAARPDVVLCVWPPLTTGLAARLVSWWRKAPLVLNVQDVYPDAIFGGGIGPKLIRKVEHHLLARAARVTVLSEGLRHEVIQRGARPETAGVIPMWTDVEGIRPGVKENAFRVAHQLGGKFVVLYSGNIGTFSGVGVAIEAAAILKDVERIRFVIVGRGHGKETLLSQAQRLQLGNVMFLDTRPRDELQELLAAADVSLVTLDPRIARTSVPSKAFTIMASARPVLAAMSPDNEVAKVVSETGCGWCVPADQPATLAQTILAAMDNPSLDEMGASGRRYVEAHHTRHALTRRHADMLMAVRNIKTGR